MASVLSALLVHGFLLLSVTAIPGFQFPFSLFFSLFYFYYPILLYTLILGTFIMSTIMGVLQYIASKYVWNRNIVRRWIPMLGSGLGLTIILQPLYITIYFYLFDFYTYYYAIRYILAYFLILGYIFLFGFIGWIFSRFYEEEGVEKMKPQVIRKPHFEEGTLSVCNRCGASHHYMKKDISNNGIVKCFSCGKEFMISSTDKLLERLEKSSESIEL